MDITKDMIPKADRDYIPEGLDSASLAFWYLAFRTGREAAAPMPTVEPETALVVAEALRPPAVGFPPEAKHNDLGDADDGFQTPAEGEDLPPDWLVRILTWARKAVPDGKEDAAEAAILADGTFKQWLSEWQEKRTAPGERVILGRAQHVLEKRRLMRTGGDF